MQKHVIETLMGAVVLTIAAGFVVFAYEGSQMRQSGKGYGVNARFSNATGLNTGSDVRIGGVKVGVVTAMALDPESYEAVVSMDVREDVKIPTDSTAAIASGGLLGDKFVSLTPGGEEQMLKEGGTVQFTQSAVSLEEMIGKFMFSGGGVDKGKPAPNAPAPETPAPSPAAPEPATGS